MNLRNAPSVSDRRKALEKERKVNLKTIGSFTLDASVASSRNCENMIGAVQVPVGVAGPLHLRTRHAELNGQRTKEYYIPLATTEGALVASVNRGCKAVTESGGATTDSHRVGATRGPVFRVNTLEQHDLMYRYLKTHFDELKHVAEGTSHHLKLEKLLTRGVGRYRYVRFVFDTADAMGMNMVTIATHALVKHIEKKLGVACISVAGNFDIDKKPSWLNSIEGRGIKVWAEVTIPPEVLQSVLKTTAQRVYEVWLAKCMIGSAMAGSMGYNAHVANVIAAIFLATGQDVGHVGECSTGITTCEVVHPPHGRKPSPIGSEKASLYVSVHLPDLMLGTVGGGTGLATQKEALELLGVAGGKRGTHAQEFAEIVGGAVLAGEISLLASLAEGTLACAHLNLARRNSAF